MYLMPLLSLPSFSFSPLLSPPPPPPRYFTLPLQKTFFLCFFPTMARRRRKTSSSHSEEVSSIEWEFINMTEQEEDLIHRMHRLVGDRWGLIAGRIPGRKAEEIERFWIMTYGELYATKREQLNRPTS